MKPTRLKISLLLFSILHFAALADLSIVEQQIVKAVDEQHHASLLLLEKSVNINSGTMNFAGVKKVASLFEQELNALGFDTEWIDGKDFNRAGHLMASFYGVKSKSSKKLLLIGHLDTVFSSNNDFQRYKRIDEHLVAGPGITDMKGGDVIIISSLKALKAANVLDKFQIKIIMTGDEEKRGSPYNIATQALIEAGKWADVAIGFEDGDGDPKTAVISRRGSTRWKLMVKGRAAHSSQIFREEYGDGAIFEASRILNQFRLSLSKQANLTFNPAVMVAGTNVEFDTSHGKGHAAGKNNVIAQSAIVSGDIRALSPQQLTNAQATMQKIVVNNLNKTSATLAFFAGYPPMAPSQGNQNLLAIYAKASQDLGFGNVEAVDPRKAGAADISFVASYVEMAIDGLGLMGTGGHTKREIADISTLNSQTKKAAILMIRLLKFNLE